MKRMEDLAAESRPPSLARSRSRGRSNPSELLARRQQLVSEESGWLLADEKPNRSKNDVAESSSVTSSSASTKNGEGASSIVDSAHHSRSLARRAKQSENSSTTNRLLTDSINGNSNSNDNSNSNYLFDQSGSVEAKLESLSELLKSHQNDTTTSSFAMMLSTNTTSTAATMNTTLLNNTNNNGLHNNNEQQAPMTPNAAKTIDDVYILLAKKEKDLQLAAELGKVLLEKNDELSKANEQITEDYSHKLELLEQEKHKLKRKLDQLDGEYENRLIELQTDCNILKNQLDDQQQLAKQTEKEKSKLIDDLVQQNQRLTNELVEATKSEELLSSQLEQMNERFNVRMSNRQDYVTQLDALKEEIQIVNQRKQDLERRLKLANQDKSNLNAALGDSGDKILLLENLLNDKEGKLNELLEEVSELRDSSCWLSQELESMISLNEKLTNHAQDNLSTGNQNNTSGMLDSFNQRKRSQLVDQLKQLRLRIKSRVKASEFMVINRRANGMNRNSHSLRRRQRMCLSSRANSANGTAGNNNKQQRDIASLLEELDESVNGTSSSSANRSPISDGYDDEEIYDHIISNELEDREVLREDIAIELFTILRKFQIALQQRKDSFTINQQHLYSPNSTDDSGISGDDIDKVASENALIVKDLAPWKRLLSSLKSLIEEMPCSTCHLMIAERADYEQLQKIHSKLLDEMKKKSDQLLKLNVVKTEQETKLAALEERCTTLSNDLNNCDKPKEEIVKLAWKARDEAVERKNAAEISLAKTRIENMQISSQLMEVVQQKGELSQKLAQFEDDIHYMTQDSVKAKFTWEEYAEQVRRSKKTQPDSTSWTGGSTTNPLVAHLLNFSAVVSGSKDNNNTNTTTTAAASNANGKLSSLANRFQTTATPTMTTTTTTTPTSMTTASNKSSAMDNNNTNSVLNFTSNRFNLRFWQRNSSEKSSPDKGVVIVDNNSSNSETND